MFKAIDKKIYSNFKHKNFANLDLGVPNFTSWLFYFVSGLASENMLMERPWWDMSNQGKNISELTQTLTLCILMDLPSGLIQ